jgi:hypothetical protein
MWQCAVSDDGRLHDCDLKAEAPKGDTRYEAASRKLLPMFQLNQDSTHVARTEHLSVLFRMPIYGANSKPLDDQRCDPPFCVPVPPPPKP